MLLALRIPRLICIKKRDVGAMVPVAARHVVALHADQDCLGQAISLA
jgi:hypothetical protein